MSEQDIYDITIIGGGPAGLFAAFYAGMRQAKTKVIETLPQLGGQLALLYPEKEIYDIPGYPSIKACDLIDNLTTQIERFNHTIVLNQEVTHLERRDDGLIELKTTEGSHLSKSVIITAGNGAFQPRKLQIEYDETLEGASLHYFVTQADKFKNQDVVICGGGDSAIDWALMLEPLAKSVTLVHRRPNFRAHEHSIELLKQSQVNVKTPFIIDSLKHIDTELEEIILKNPKTGEIESLVADHMVINYGFLSHLGEINNWELDLNRQAIKVNSDMSTNIPGVYAAGDICTYEGKVKLIATGFGEAPTAVNNALYFIKPDARRQPAHSTSLFSEK
ncbi:NAD(P)/FAD-dependent oxidoreductase [Vagococcus intermedius]|uniref:Ferredoxin--NADP reductase n=1 Tax=Vagococcus intermedius TaxID=2991418 RepID=A0AAF0I5D5_9ENTE|nr:NAD(P)/FAD-dependent oxidoreductase [Vagococcus intermedius]WEG72913.1 NAD(P)/FAD-dependent oxidoreductase [Vagococcus intermedius]WEG75000.1 NAD(P)/FAD-dependent oxidoreductase [Vagococcus intermedius]